jgi:dipeptidyl-peptidase-4
MSQRAIALAVALLASASPLAAQQRLTVEAIFGSQEYAGDLVSLQWSVDGRRYTVLEPGATGGTDLYRVEPASGARELVVRGSELLPPGGSRPIVIEGYQFSPDGSQLLLYTNSVRVWRQNTKGEYYLFDIGSRTLAPLSAVPGLQQFAKFSPDGRYVGFVRENDLYVRDLEAGRELRLTSDGSEDVINGTSDWVYEEELDLRDAFRFSPDGRWIALWRFDQSAIRPFYLVDETTLYPELEPVRYPKAGTHNSEVRIGVVEVATGGVTWVDLGSERDIYVAEAGFAGSPAQLWLTRLNRHQNRLDLLLADARTGASRVIMSDRDSAWVDATVPRWLDSGRRFLFASERDGHRHLYLYARDGSLIRKVTDGAWDVTDVFAVDERRGIVYFTGTVDGPLVRPVYRVGLDGRGLRRLSARRGWHSAAFDPRGELYVDTYSSAAAPPVQSLHRAQDGRLVRVIADNATLAAKLQGLELAPPEFLELPLAGGLRLNASLIKPADFDSTRQYPLLLYVYGGPGSQTVADAWGGQRYLWHQLLAGEGYLVASVDNRGTGGRGRDFKKATYRRLGQLESADQIAAAGHLARLPYVDRERIGIWGWSYGGYLSLLSVLLGADVFRAAIAVAPVTDWRLYDTIYTERYMRSPEENPEGYQRGAPLSYAARLQGRLLVVHGTGDDNVHPQNTTLLIEGLEDAGKQFDMRLYPNKTHAIAGSATRVNLYNMLTEWLRANL